MKRVLQLSLFAGLVALLGGCPIYSDNSSDYRVCTGGTCYDCPNDVYSSACVPWQCASSLDCPQSYYCNGNAQCTSPSTGGNGAEDAGAATFPDATTSSCGQPSDCPSGTTCSASGQCVQGDCSTNGCPSGWTCVLESGAAVCAPSAPSDSGVWDAWVPPPPQDAAVNDAGLPTLACQQSSECALPDGGASGAICLDGTCVPPVNQCYDGTQCVAGDKCVQGACTPTCGGSVACPTGYSCDTTNGVCTGNPTSCESNPQACADGTICSQNHCVAACGSGGACPSGELCLQGGCVPAQLPVFACNKDGVQDACKSGSICLHHSCYIACAADAGPDASTACQSADQFNECKAVTTSSGTYDVCGSSSNLGSQCDPTAGVSCPSAGVCIDGYCH